MVEGPRPKGIALRSRSVGGLECREDGRPRWGDAGTAVPAAQESGRRPSGAMWDVSDVWRQPLPRLCCCSVGFWERRLLPCNRSPARAPGAHLCEADSAPVPMRRAPPRNTFYPVAVPAIRMGLESDNQLRVVERPSFICSSSRREKGMLKIL